MWGFCLKCYDNQNKGCTFVETNKEKDMKAFKNKNFEKRNDNRTNLVFCQSENSPSENWVECDELELDCSDCIHLYTQAGVRYFGYL
jgi:hypothetical protein